MKILFVTTKGPLPLNDEHSLRCFNMLQEVAKVHEVHLVSFVKSRQEYHCAGDLKRFCRSVHLVELPEIITKAAVSIFTRSAFLVGKYTSSVMRRNIRHLVQREPFDIIHFDMLPLAVYMDEARGAKVVLNEHSVESRLLAQRIDREKNPVWRWYYAQQQAQVELFERTAVQRADCVLAWSENDSVLLKQFDETTPVVTLPSGVDISYFCPTPDFLWGEDNNLIFVGGMDWRPNLDALKWFDRRVFPHVLKERPGTRLHVIGQRRVHRWRHPDNIVCHGYVEDIRPFLAKAAIFILPLRMGSASRLKILNAMAAGKAVVTTSIGAEGLKVIHGENILVADRDYHLARSICRLLANREKRWKIGARARQFIVDNYQWRDIANILLSTYDQLCQR